MTRNPSMRVASPMVAKDHTYELVDLGLMFRNFIDIGLSSGGHTEILIQTGDKYPHVLFNAIADGDTLIQIYAGTTVSDEGTEENSGNFNFNSSTATPLTKFYSSPTITDDGTYVAMTRILGGSGVGTPAAARAAASINNLDVVLIPNTNFMLRFTNQAGRDLQILFEANLIENEHDLTV